MPRKNCPPCMSNFSLCMCSLVELIPPMPLLSFDLRIHFYESPDSLLTEYDLYDEFQAAGVSGQPDL